MADHASETPNKFIPSPEARQWLYGIAVAIAALLGLYGVLTIEEGTGWLAVVGALLGLPQLLAAGNTPKR